MKKLIAILTLATLATGCSVQLGKGKSKNSGTAVRNDVIANEFVFAGDEALVGRYLNSMGIDATIIPVAKGAQAFQVRYKGNVDYETLASGLESQVEYIEPNFKVRAEASMDRYSWPNDRLFFKQWALNNIGQSPPFGLPGTEGADMDLLKGWSITKGSKQVVVAVIDTGVDYTHPDLKDNMWVNEKESEQKGGVPGRDDDGNGLIDDVYGYDFYSGGRQEIKFGAPGDNEPMDEDGHGTHCAGSIGAISGNAQGIVGMNQQVSIMALRFLGAGGGSTVDAVRAIYYAIDKKANVMSNSWGGGGDSKLLRDAIADAQKAGILFVVAAGNDGSNIDIKPSYPASYDKDSRGNPLTNILSVGASDNQDNPAEFSNYGHEGVDVFAPGVHIVSTYPVALAQARPYAVMSGTSMAAPYVSGLAVLMMANNPGLRNQPETVRQIIMNSADVKESLLGKAASPGRINVTKALQQKSDLAQKPNWLAKNQSIKERGYQQNVVDIRHEIKVDGAKAIRVHFDFIQIEEPYDSLYLYDKNLRLITHVEETQTRDHWSATIPGDTVTVRFTNSLVRQIVMGMAPPQSSEAACMALGAEEVLQSGTEFRCMTDSESSGSSKTYSTFNSEGFSIDRIEYLAADGGKK
ncbi:MAG: S8 family peptidase [Bdellovibrionales bacterium]